MKRIVVFLLAVSFLFIPVAAEATEIAAAGPVFPNAKRSLISLEVEADILSVDAHGDFTIDLTTEEFRKAGFSPGDLVSVAISDKFFEVLVSHLYCLIPADELYIYMGEDDENIKLEGCMVFAITKAGIAEREYEDGKTIWRLNPGEHIDKLTITLIEKAYDPVIAGAPDLYRSLNRSDYSSDTVYANFRAVRLGDIAPDTLYRSCSPIDNYLNRSEVADQLAKTSGIQTFLNLSESDKSLSGNIDRYGNLCPYYCGKTIINDWFAQDFTDPIEMEKLGSVLTDLSEMPTPWLIHCSEGKDRTGFVCVLLEMLLNAGREEIETDYTLSFINYFHLEDQPELCAAIGARMVGGMMKQIGKPREYLTACGMKEDTINLLISKLSAS